MALRFVSAEAREIEIRQLAYYIVVLQHRPVAAGSVGSQGIQGDALFLAVWRLAWGGTAARALPLGPAGMRKREVSASSLF